MKTFTATQLNKKPQEVFAAAKEDGEVCIRHDRYPDNLFVIKLRPSAAIQKAGGVFNRFKGLEVLERERDNLLEADRNESQKLLKIFLAEFEAKEVEALEQLNKDVYNPNAVSSKANLPANKLAVKKAIKEREASSDPAPDQ